MKKLAAVLVGMAIALAAASPGGTADAGGYKATITYLKGIARLQPAGGGAVTGLSLGQPLGEGDTVITRENTRCEIKLENGTSIRIGPATKFTITTLKGTQLGGVRAMLKLVTGRLWFSVAKLTGDSEMVTQTPTVVAAVKGTVYRADVGAKGASDLVVYDGVVTASRQGQPDVSLGAMERLAAMPNAAFEKGAVDDSADDKDDWVRWNKSRDKLRVMIIIPEKRGDEKATASVTENTVMARFMRNYMFKVVEKATVDRIREGEKLKAALKGDQAAAAAAGLEVAADLIVVGEATARYFKGQALGGLISATANLTARAVRADTAEVIASAAGIRASAVAITDEDAAQKALMSVGEKLGSQFVDSIITKWRRDARKGAALDVVVDGVDFKKLKTVVNTLSRIEGVKDVQQLYLVGKRSLLNLIYQGDTQGLAEAVEAAKFKGIVVNVVGLSAYKLELEVTVPKARSAAGEETGAEMAQAVEPAKAEPGKTDAVKAGPAVAETAGARPAATEGEKTEPETAKTGNEPAEAGAGR